MKKYLVLCVASIMMIGIALYGQHMHKGHTSVHHKGVLVMKGQKEGLIVEGYCNDIKTAMKEMMKNSGMKFDESKLDPEITHHMSFFVSGDNAGSVKGASVTLKLGKSEKTYTLMMMKNHYGSDVSLKQKGVYNGTLVLDTVNKGKVIFTFSFTI